jgi:hypothetical protein
MFSKLENVPKRAPTLTLNLFKRKEAKKICVSFLFGKNYSTKKKNVSKL